MTSPSLTQAIEANRGRPCSNPRCSYPRYRLEATCKSCSLRYLAYGSATGRAIPAGAWKPYRQEVQRLLSIKPNDQHPTFLTAVQYVEDWLERAKKADEPTDLGYVDRFRGYREAQRLVRGGVPGRLIVETLAAVSMFIDKAPAMTELEEKHAYARAVFGLAQRNTRVSYVSGRKRTYRDRASRASLVATGGMFMDELSLFLALAKAGVQDMVHGASKRAADREAARRAPFAVG